MTNLPLPEVEEIEDKPLSQWHREILAQANAMPTSVKVWDSEPCRGYEIKHINNTLTDDFGDTKKIDRNHHGYDWPKRAI